MYDNRQINLKITYATSYALAIFSTK